MVTTATIPQAEMLHVADAVAREKGIDREEVLQAMEQAIQKAGRAKYGPEHDIRAHIDRRTGAVNLSRFRLIVDVIENEFTEILLEDAKHVRSNAEIGDEISDILPPVEFGRIAAQTAKQVIVQRVREAERHRQYIEFKDRVGEVINGLVKRVEFGHVTIDLGRAEAVLRREELIQRETYRNGDRVRACIFDVREESKGPQIFLSRTHPTFLAKLFAQEVPEIYDGVIEIKSVARDPGSRAKIAVISNDSSIDPIGACVGMRGSRVQAVVTELQGEKVDIIPWSSDPATFVVNALQPAEVAKVVLDEDAMRIEVVVPSDQLSLAIGRRGQNVRLASILTGWDIDIMTEEEDTQRRGDELKERSQMFIEKLDVEEVIAHLLVAEGFTTLEEVAYVAIEELSEIEGFDENVSSELQERARQSIETRDQAFADEIDSLILSEDLRNFEGLSVEDLIALGKKDIATLDDLADLASDELIEILEHRRLDMAEANNIIMAARAHWFEEAAEASEEATD